MVDQITSKFLATKLDGFRIESGDARKVSDGWRVWVVGKRPDVPAALGFTHATEQQIDLMMTPSTVGVGGCLAGTTLTVMHTRKWL